MELYGTAAGAALLVALLAFGAAALRRRSRPSGRPRPPGRPAPRPSSSGPAAPGRLPEPGEIWWARVPFEDGVGGKDRPCLVLRRGTRTATVLKVTSKHHAELPGVVELPPGTVDDREHRVSWLETEESREVPLADFRRRVGAVDARLWARVGRARAR